MVLRRQGKHLRRRGRRQDRRHLRLQPAKASSSASSRAGDGDQLRLRRQGPQDAVRHRGQVAVPRADAGDGVRAVLAGRKVNRAQHAASCTAPEQKGDAAHFQICAAAPLRSRGGPVILHFGKQRTGWRPSRFAVFHLRPPYLERYPQRCGRPLLDRTARQFGSAMAHASATNGRRHDAPHADRRTGLRRLACRPV